MIDAQLKLYILSCYPNSINTLIDLDTGSIPSVDISINFPIDYQLVKLLNSYVYGIPEKFANFRLVDTDIIDNKLILTYLIMIGSKTADTTQCKQSTYVSIETLLNENTHRVIQKIKNII